MQKSRSSFFKRHRSWTIIILSMLAAFIAIFLTASDTRLKITRYEVRSCELPASFDGMTIMHLSDIHGQITQKLYDYVSENRPSVAVITGDTVDEDGQSDEVFDFLQMLAEQTPTFIVTGNHEQWSDDTESILERYRSCNAVVIDGETVALQCGGEKIYLTGVADPAFVDRELALNELLGQKGFSVRQNGFNILLFHRADFMGCFENSGYDLILSGHVHGGEIRVPFVGGIRSPEGSWLPNFSGGIYQLSDGSVGISNRGLINDGRFKRIYNRPEIVMIELRCQTSP